MEGPRVGSLNRRIISEMSSTRALASAVILISMVGNGCDYVLSDWIYLECAPSTERNSPEDFALFEQVTRDAASEWRLKSVDARAGCLSWEGPDDHRTVSLELCRETNALYCGDVPCVMLQGLEREWLVMVPRQYTDFRQHLLDGLREAFGERIKVNAHR